MILNCEPLEEVACVKHLGRKWQLMEDVIGMNRGYREWGVLNSVLSNVVLRIKAKKCLYEGVIVQTVFYGAEAWGMRTAERRKVNAFVKCLRILVGVSRMDRVRNEEVCRRTG